MISSTSGFLFFIDRKFIVSTLSGSEIFDVWASFLFLPCFFLVVDDDCVWFIWIGDDVYVGNPKLWYAKLLHNFFQ
jgi:hypothetical protein